MLPTLTEVLKRYPGTDKSTLHSYNEVYEQLFEPIRLQVTSICEVGCRDGSSLKTWRDYFPNATHIVGLDNGEEMGLWKSDDPKIEVFYADTTQPWTVTKALSRFSHGFFDIIIDDGNHKSWAQATTYGVLRPYLAAGGIYCIEDVEHIVEGEKLQSLLGGELIDRRKVKNRHDDVLLVFKN